MNPGRFLCGCFFLLVWSAAAGISHGEQATANYRLAPNDLLEISVFQEDDLTTKARIAQDGRIGFPLVGAINLGGKTLEEASQVIRAKLADGYLVNPQVNVTIMEYAKLRFTIIGEVKNPGTYEFPNEESLNLLEAVALAGGFTRIANPGKITLKRPGEGRDGIYRLDAKAMARDLNEIFLIKPGDTISVPESLF